MAHVSDIRTSGTSIATRAADLRATLTARLAQYRIYRRTLHELENLSDRELNDLGLSRSGLKAIALEAAYT